MAVLMAMQGALSQGILWGLMTLGVFLTFRILNIADMTVDGSFALGGAVSAVLITCGMNPYYVMFFAMIAGSVAGFFTGFMNTKLKINVLLASILTQIALYSVCIRVMTKSNISLLTLPGLEKNTANIWQNLTSFYSGRPVPRNIAVVTMMSNLQDRFSINPTNASLILGVIIVAVVVALMYWFFGTEIGSAIRASGNNAAMARSLGVNTDNVTIMGLMISNALVALSGCLVAQSQGYADVGMGTGTIVVGLASIIIGEVIFGSHFGFWYLLLTSVFGSIIYRIVIATVLQLGLKSTDLKLLTALIVAVALSFPVIKKKFNKSAKLSPGINIPDEPDTRHSAVIKRTRSEE